MAAIAAATAGGLAGCATGGPCRGASAATAAPSPPGAGFRGVPPDFADRLVVPEGHVAQVLPPGANRWPAWAMPAFRMDAGNSAAEQAQQLGMHHDGMHYFPLDAGPRRPAAAASVGDQPRVHRRWPAAPGGMVD